MTVAILHGRYRLAEVVRRMDGLEYPAAAQAVRRFGEQLASDLERKRFVENLRRHLGEAEEVE